MQQSTINEARRARDAQIVSLRKTGVPYADIRNRLGVSNDTIGKALNRHGVATDPRGVFDWTEVAIATATRMWLGGSSATDIGIEIGCSKNAVIGKLGRLGVKRAEELNVQNRRHQKRSAPRDPAPKPRPKMVSVASQDGERVYLVPEGQAPKTKLEPVSPLLPGEDPVLKLRALDCRFPIGEPGRAGFHFCCKPARLQVRLAGSPRYCEEHAKLCSDGKGVRKASAKPLSMHKAPVDFRRGRR